MLTPPKGKGKPIYLKVVGDIPYICEPRSQSRPAAFGPVTSSVSVSTSVGSEPGSSCESEDVEESGSGTPVVPSAPAKEPELDGKPEAVVSPVPTGKAAEGSLSKEARLREEAESFRHLLTHLPKNPYSSACQCGKLVKVHHRRRIPQEDAAASFGDK